MVGDIGQVWMEFIIGFGSARVMGWRLGVNFSFKRSEWQEKWIEG